MKRILVVDDNTEYLQVLSSVLSGDFDTIKATGVKEALTYFKQSQLMQSVPIST